MADLDAYSPEFVLFDSANDTNTLFSKKVMEAYLRTIRTNHPLAHIYFLRTYTAVPQWAVDLADYYDASVIDWLTWSTNDVALGNHAWSDWYDDPIGRLHPNDGGALSIEAFAEPIMTADLAITNQWTGNIADYARLYDNGDYENTPTRLLANSQNTGTTGTWSHPSGSRMTSSEVGATISFAATCQSIGISPHGGPTIKLTIDGGAPVTTGLGATGYELSSRASHTITIEVLSGTVTIDYFLAV